MITATNEQHKDITRNLSHFKKIGKSKIMTDEEIEEVTDDDIIPNTSLRRSSREKQTPKHLDDYKPNIQKKENVLLPQHDDMSSDFPYGNIEVFKLSYLEYKKLQFFCEDSQIFNGRYEYKDGVLLRFLNPNEKKANLQTVFQSKMDFIQSLTSSSIACPSTISDETFYEIQKLHLLTKKFTVLGQRIKI
ncbi:unnamed protein product [Mytilus coruscus]|uniref:Uncharacterized protein n=1 Tax=Mytilus coruscus TaxID=42192 RepID=A0A6J8CIP0_MYTCO|nr:unnamed protein product [Mytilus coruscus]